MKITKAQQILDIKTGNSQQSDIDLFSKLQNSFLQKFFKYNLTDYFSQQFTNVYEDIFDKKTTIKHQKGVASSLFVANNDFSVNQLTSRIQKFYTSKSKSLAQNLLPFGFKKLYCNLSSDDTIKKQQLIFVDVKIKTEVQKIQEVPQKILKLFSSFKCHKKQNMSQLEMFFSQYKQEYFNVFFVYFGDVNFNLFKKQKYKVQSIKIQNNSFKLRIFVFFVSKQGLTQSFRLINKLQNLEYINDLVIQFYELKRQKNRRRRQVKRAIVKKKQQQDSSKPQLQMKHLALGLIGVVSLTIFGITMKKLFF